MSTVTKRIQEIKQPRGGYLKPSDFREICFEDGETLGKENVHASVTGLAVDYLIRFLLGAAVKEAFQISEQGAAVRGLYALEGKVPGMKREYSIESLLSQIRGTDDASIAAACRAVTYDVWARNLMGAMRSQNAEETDPDAQTIHNIRVMLNRALAFWEEYGPIVKAGASFDAKAYTKVVTDGELDYLTADTLWDLKVSERKPTSRHTLQLLMYWIMGQHSENEMFRGVSQLGIFNPRLNRAYLLDTAAIPAEIIRTVEKEVICYR